MPGIASITNIQRQFACVRMNRAGRVCRQRAYRQAHQNNNHGRARALGLREPVADQDERAGEHAALRPGRSRRNHAPPPASCASGTFFGLPDRGKGDQRDLEDDVTLEEQAGRETERGG